MLVLRRRFKSVLLYQANARMRCCVVRRNHLHRKTHVNLQSGGVERRISSAEAYRLTQAITNKIQIRSCRLRLKGERKSRRSRYEYHRSIRGTTEWRRSWSVPALVPERGHVKPGPHRARQTRTFSSETRPERRSRATLPAMSTQSYANQPATISQSLRRNLRDIVYTATDWLVRNAERP